MTACERFETVSAAIDGELPEPERQRALDHATNCPTCSTALTMAADLQHAAVLRSADHDQPAGFDPAALTAQEQRWMGGRWARRLLVVAALIIVLEAIPAYVTGRGLSAESHAARHLGAWQIGFGVGLLVAALFSRMSHAMLALAVTFAVLTVGATIIDIVGGHSGTWVESVHLVELVGVFLLWRLTPPHLIPWRRDPETRYDADDTSSSPGLRLVEPKSRNDPPAQ